MEISPGKHLKRRLQDIQQTKEVINLQYIDTLEYILYCKYCAY